MLAIDTNILIFAEIRSSPHHVVAKRMITELAEGISPWAIPWPCIYEFLRIVTHPRVYHPPVPIPVALRDLNHILESPTLVLLHETLDHPRVMNQIIEESGVTGNLIHDAHIAALCQEHGITELISGDRDFTRFPTLKVRNPFI